ncbi:hypothetical protein [Alteromonas phage JH01]|nr:hypothetical protein [Alteromonas phage JH01]
MCASYVLFDYLQGDIMNYSTALSLLQNTFDGVTHSAEFIALNVLKEAANKNSAAYKMVCDLLNNDFNCENSGYLASNVFDTNLHKFWSKHQVIALAKLVKKVGLTKPVDVEQCNRETVSGQPVKCFDMVSTFVGITATGSQWVIHNENNAEHSLYKFKKQGETLKNSKPVKRSKSAQLDLDVKHYILECVEGDSVDQKIAYIADRFTSEYGFQIERVGRQKAMTEWLQGLALNIAFMNCEILQLAHKWGSLPADATEKQEDKILNNYWNLMAAKTLQLIEGYHVPKGAK